MMQVMEEFYWLAGALLITLTLQDVLIRIPLVCEMISSAFNFVSVVTHAMEVDWGTTLLRRDLLIISC